MIDYQFDVRKDSRATGQVYKVTIEEVLKKQVYVLASSAMEAEDEIEALCKAGDIMIEYEDFESRSVYAVGQK